MSEQAHIEDTIGFWDERHADLGPWRSGGDRGLTNEENQEFYAVRLGRMVELIRRHAGGERRQRILDVGCGRGHMVNSMRSFGHAAYGVDTSPTAIEGARESYGEEPFSVGTVHDYQSAMPFGVVMCIDVLFHILDDDEWRKTIAGLSRHAAAESFLIITDVMSSERHTISNYIVHRSAKMYDEELQKHGFRRVETMPYAFGANPNQFAVFERRF